jgi:hypothetical protein
MARLDELTKTIHALLADARTRDAIRMLRETLRPNPDFQQELLLYEHNLQHAESAFAAGTMTAQAKMQALALAANGVQGLLSRLQPNDLLPAPGNLTDAERSGKQNLLKLASQKRDRLQEALLLETDAARCFAYEKKIEELNTQIATLKSELNP